MIEHIWTVLCSESSVDKDSNNISLLGVIEQVGVDQRPEEGDLARVSLELVSLWSRTDLEHGERGEGRWRIETAGGTTHEGEIFPIDLTEYRRLRTRNQFDGLPLNGVGYHWFVVEFRYDDDEPWNEVSRVPVEVRLIED